LAGLIEDDFDGEFRRPRRWRRWSRSTGPTRFFYIAHFKCCQPCASAAVRCRACDAFVAGKWLIVAVARRSNKPLARLMSGGAVRTAPACDVQGAGRGARRCSARCAGVQESGQGPTPVPHVLAGFRACASAPRPDRRARERGGLYPIAPLPAAGAQARCSATADLPTDLDAAMRYSAIACIP
jgi:hypothetical protein